MTNSIRIHRPCFTTHADGSDAVLTIHEITGRGDGPTIGISGAIHGNEPTGTEIILELYRVLQTHPDPRPPPPPAGRQPPRLCAEPPLHADR